MNFAPNTNATITSAHDPNSTLITPKILIVDDVYANRLSLRRLLNKELVEILEAASGNDALALCLEHEFALVLLDVNMPDMDGYEVAEIMREDPQIRSTPIIFITAAQSDELHRLKGYHAGGVDYIQKPIDDTILRSKVRVFLELYVRRQIHQEQVRRLREKTQQLEKEVSERKQAEEAMRQAKEEAERANRAKGRFLSTMSHEIRTPLNGVLGMAQLLAKTPLDDKQKRYTHLIQQSGKLLLTLLNDVLDFSKVEENRIILELLPFDLRTLMDETIGLFAFVRSEKKNVEIVTTLPPKAERRLVGDPTRLRQVLFNLIGNAMKFTDHGLVTVSAEIIAEDNDSRTIRFIIKDSGIGISNESLSKLFTPFFQADSSTTRRYGGTGLGLSISRQLVVLMGGDIQVESQLGLGSTFQFTLRFTLEEQILLPWHDASTLLVHDDPITTLFLEKMLKACGIGSVTVVDSGDMALELLEQNSYSIVLVNPLLPEVQNDQLRQHLRANPSSKTNAFLPAVIAIMEEEEEEDILNTFGIDAVMVKPENRAAMDEALRQWFPNTL